MIGWICHLLAARLIPWEPSEIPEFRFIVFPEKKAWAMMVTETNFLGFETDHLIRPFFFKCSKMGRGRAFVSRRFCQTQRPFRMFSAEYKPKVFCALCNRGRPDRLWQCVGHTLPCGSVCMHGVVMDGYTMKTATLPLIAI